MDEMLAMLRGLQWSATREGSACCPCCGAAEPEGRHSDQCRLAILLAAGAGDPPRWRHRKRGTTYRELGLATLQHSGGVLDDGDTVVVYRSESDGTLGVRALLEFSDGRFERLDP